MPVYIDSDDDSDCNTNTSIDLDQCSTTDSVCCDSESVIDEDTCHQDISNNTIDDINAVDIASIFNYKINKQTNHDTLCIRFAKMDITFQDFKRLFYKKKCGGQYHLLKTTFINTLLNNVKPLILNHLINMNHNINCLHSKTKILLYREIWSLDIVNHIEKYDVLHYSECMRSLYSLDKTVVRITLNMLLSSISVIAKIVFLFDISQIPENPDQPVLDISIC